MYLVASDHAVQYIINKDNDDRTADQGCSCADRGCAAPVHADYVWEESSCRAEREAEHQDREQAARVEQRDEHCKYTDEEHGNLSHSHDLLAVRVFADELLVDIICKYRTGTEQVGV